MCDEDIIHRCDIWVQKVFIVTSLQLNTRNSVVGISICLSDFCSQFTTLNVFIYFAVLIYFLGLLHRTLSK
jgi:hypothetical protein